MQILIFSQTPLHLCAGSMQKLELSYLLIEHGARVEDNDLDGIRPIDINIVRILIFIKNIYFHQNKSNQVLYFKKITLQI